MATYRVYYFDKPDCFEEVQADHMYASDWCAVFCDERDNPTKIIHANVVRVVELKPQTH